MELPITLETLQSVARKRSDRERQHEMDSVAALLKACAGAGIDEVTIYHGIVPPGASRVDLSELPGPFPNVVALYKDPGNALVTKLVSLGEVQRLCVAKNLCAVFQPCMGLTISGWAVPVYAQPPVPQPVPPPVPQPVPWASPQPARACAPVSLSDVLADALWPSDEEVVPSRLNIAKRLISRRIEYRMGEDLYGVWHNEAVDFLNDK